MNACSPSWRGMEKFRAKQRVLKTIGRASTQRIGYVEILGSVSSTRNVIGFEQGERWWTLFADRNDTAGADGAECWNIEAYNHNGRSWSDRFLFWPEPTGWQHASFLRTGDD